MLKCALSGFSFLFLASAAQATTFGYSGNVVDDLIIQPGYYAVTAIGASGGVGGGTLGGAGVAADGTFYFAANTLLELRSAVSAEAGTTA